MAKIPFSIKFRPQIESGEYKVVTSDGFPARIICWDSPIDKDRPIICIVFDNQIEQYRVDGRFDYHETTNYDLFLITKEPELSAFEKALKECVNVRNPEKTMTDNGARNNATILRAIAFKEFKENEAEHIKELVEQKEKEAYEMGKSEALKDLPRWDGNLKSSMVDEADVIGQWLYYKEHRIKLSDLEKLPGFND